MAPPQSWCGRHRPRVRCSSVPSDCPASIQECGGDVHNPVRPINCESSTEKVCLGCPTIQNVASWQQFSYKFFSVASASLSRHSVLCDNEAKFVAQVSPLNGHSLNVLTRKPVTP